MSNNILLKSHIEELIKLFRKGYFKETLEKTNLLIKEFGDEPFLYNLKGMAEIKNNEFFSSIISFDKAIKIKPSYIEAYNNIATSYINIGEFEKAVIFLKKVIKLKPDYANAYNNLASVLNDQGKYEESLNMFNTLLRIDSSYPGVKENIVKILTFHEPRNKHLNIFIELNELLRKVQLKGDFSDVNILNFYKSCDQIVLNKLDNLKFNFSQIWRRNNIDLNCNRHFDVFRNYNVIPEYCFGCFKVQIELGSLSDLFRLYFVFDKLNLKDNKSRKCITEMRPIAKGNYKGLIYCTGIDEAKSMYKILNNESQNIFNKKTIIKLRRGCTEFGNAYPEYKNINRPKNEFMKYNKHWKEKEKLVDQSFPIKNRVNQRVLNDTIKGTTLNDFLIMKNWVMYAKQIKDPDYKKFDPKIKISEHMSNNLSNQLSYRTNEFKSFGLLPK